ncbi:MAG: acyl-CoA thioesterase [Anaerolineae bacterium]|nr:acyl-CoA thioesterase [Anaerolineae bacterium]
MTEAERRPLLIERPIVVRTYDIDFANIVHNIVYFRWLEDLRSEILADVLPIADILSGGVSPIVTASAIEYRSPVRLGDAVVGRMWVAELGNTRWTLAAEMLVGERLCATARQSGIFVDLKTLRPVRVPDRLRVAWERGVSS